MTNEAKGTSGKKFRSLEEFDREFFPASTHRRSAERGDPKKLGARLVRLVSGSIQEQARRRAIGTRSGERTSGEFNVPTG